MSISVNGQSCVPPGFCFHPTKEELLSYYLRKKVACEKIDLDVIGDVDLNKLEPWDIQEKCKIGSMPQNEWYFFSHKDKKYPTGTRTNRATAAGFWKATGRDKIIYSYCKRTGMRKTLVFYKGRAPHGQKSDWIMHEYRLDDPSKSNSQFNIASSMGETSMNQEDGWVVCRVFKKKSLNKAILDRPNNSSSISTDSELDQILNYMERSLNQETEFSIINDINTNSRFMKLPALETPTIENHFSNKSRYQSNKGTSACIDEPPLGDWVSLHRLVASKLNGSDESVQLACYDYNDDSGGGCSRNGDGDLWSLASSGSNYISHESHGLINSLPNQFMDKSMDFEGA